LGDKNKLPTSGRLEIVDEKRSLEEEERLDKIAEKGGN